MSSPRLRVNLSLPFDSPEPPHPALARRLRRTLGFLEAEVRQAGLRGGCICGRYVADVADGTHAGDCRLAQALLDVGLAEEVPS